MNSLLDSVLRDQNFTITITRDRDRDRDRAWLENFFMFVIVIVNCNVFFFVIVIVIVTETKIRQSRLEYLNSKFQVFIQKQNLTSGGFRGGGDGAIAPPP